MALDTIARFSSVLSLLGSLGLIVSHAMGEKKKNPINQIVFSLCIKDFLGSLFTFLARWPTQSFGTFQALNNPILCNIQAVGIQWFFVAGMYWTGVIAMQVLFAVIKNKPITPTAQKYFHIAVWIVSGVPAIGLLFAGENNESVYGDAILWCWITSKYSLYKIVLYYVPVWLTFAFNTISYCYVYWYLRDSQKQIANIAKANGSYGTAARRSVASKQHKVLSFISKASNFMLAFGVVWIWNCINGLHNISDASHPLYGLMVMQAIFTPLQGFVNSSVYFSISLNDEEKQAVDDAPTSDVGVTPMNISVVPAGTLLRQGTMSRQQMRDEITGELIPMTRPQSMMNRDPMTLHLDTKPINTTSLQLPGQLQESVRPINPTPISATTVPTTIPNSTVETNNSGSIHSSNSSSSTTKFPILKSQQQQPILQSRRPHSLILQSSLTKPENDMRRPSLAEKPSLDVKARNLDSNGLPGSPKRVSIVIQQSSTSTISGTTTRGSPSKILIIPGEDEEHLFETSGGSLPETGIVSHVAQQCHSPASSSGASIPEEPAEMDSQHGKPSFDKQ